MGNISDLSDKELKKIEELIKKAQRIDEIELFPSRKIRKRTQELKIRQETDSVCFNDIIIE